jgi:hypothetical protein
VFVTNTLLNVPCILNWYAAAHTLVNVLTFVALEAWGFYTSLAGKPPWRTSSSSNDPGRSITIALRTLGSGCGPPNLEQLRGHLRAQCFKFGQRAACRHACLLHER